MVSRRVLLALAFALLALPAPASGMVAFLDRAPLQETPAREVAPLPSLEERLQDAYAGSAGERLDREDVDVSMDLEFRELDFDALGVLLGGGSFVAEGRLITRLDFHVLSVGRVQEAMEGAAPLDLSDHGVDARGQHLSADAFRATLAGEALAAFQREQEDRVAALITGSFPEVTVLQARASWSNTSAAVNARGDEPPTPGRPAPRMDARNPPVTLVSVVELQYHRRESLLGLLEKAWSPGSADARSAQHDRLADETRGAPHERSLFGVFGIPQFIHVNAPPGWDVALRLRLPEGFTFEEASPDVTLDEARREARTVALARESGEEVASTIALTLGSRHLVALALLALVLGTGWLVRVPATLLANRLMHPR